MNKPHAPAPAMDQPEEQPEPVGFAKDQGGLIGDLTTAARGAALLLLAAQEHLSEPEWCNLAAGLSTTLKAIADEVDVYHFRTAGDIASVEFPEHLAYVLEKELAKVRAKITEKGQTHGES